MEREIATVGFRECLLSEGERIETVCLAYMRILHTLAVVLVEHVYFFELTGPQQLPLLTFEMNLAIPPPLQLPAGHPGFPPGSRRAVRPPSSLARRRCSRRARRSAPRDRGRRRADRRPRSPGPRRPCRTRRPAAGRRSR